MATIKKLKDFTPEINACVKCGICQAHCPVYRQGRREGDVARGKITEAASLLTEEIGLEKSLTVDVSMCLMCGSCMHKCPNNVPTHEIVGAMRRDFAEQEGLSKTGKLVSTLLGHKNLMRISAKAGALFSPLLLRKLPRDSGLRLRFPLKMMRDRTFPRVQFKNLFNRVPEYVPAAQSQGTVGFFAGCSITYLYPQIGESMIKILTGLGYSVHTPRAQGCCGIPALSSGDGDLVLRLSEANMAAFGKYQETHIITACGSCNGGLKEYGSILEGGNAAFSDKVIDFSVFLKEAGLFERLAKMKRWERRQKVAYHDPCHLKTQGITEEPRQLLASLPGVDYVEMKDASLCCGLGGTFSVYHYDISKAIGAVKLEGIVDSGAEVIATICPGCIMQLQDIVNHAGLEIKVVHVLDLVAEALLNTGGVPLQGLMGS